MIQRLLNLLPDAMPDPGPVLPAALVGLGLVVWLTGSRLSRSLFTLILVAVGALVGQRLPAWTGVGLDPMAGGVIGALVLGVLGFALHRWCVMASLAALGAAWGVLGVWCKSTEPTTWRWPAWPLEASGWKLGAWGRDVIAQLPSGVANAMLGAAVIGLLAGGTLALLLPRIATRVLWAMAGTTLALGTGVAWAATHAPQRLEQLPKTDQGQAILLGLFLAAGIAGQWIFGRQSTPRTADSAEPAKA